MSTKDFFLMGISIIFDCITVYTLSQSKMHLLYLKPSSGQF